MSSFTNKEFLEYIEGLDFYELEDIAEFTHLYWQEFIKNPDDYDAKYKYNACMAVYGHLFLYYTREAIKIRKDHENRQALEHQS